jgi:hypothetical protein
MKAERRSAIQSWSTGRISAFAFATSVIVLGLLVLSFALPQPGAILLQIAVIVLVGFGTRVFIVWGASRQRF